MRLIRNIDGTGLMLLSIQISRSRGTCSKTVQMRRRAGLTRAVRKKRAVKAISNIYRIRIQCRGRMSHHSNPKYQASTQENSQSKNLPGTFISQFRRIESRLMVCKEQVSNKQVQTHRTQMANLNKIPPRVKWK